MLNIRKSTSQDVEEILAIYDGARAYMIEHGNPSQWEAGYPDRETLEKDIGEGNSYVMVDGEEIVASFSFIIGPDPTYSWIENGSWRADRLYGTIHRLASKGKTNGIARTCFTYCSGQIDYLRIDTHKDNQIMRNAILNFGFKECGIIYVRNGSTRLAYDYME